MNGRPTGAAVQPVLQLLQRRAGLTFPESRQGGAQAAVERAMHLAGTSDVAAYLKRLAADGPILDALIDECTVGETYFSRDPGQLEYIRREVLPSIAERRPEQRLRVWSAGCASGEEAYSLAILLRESGLRARSEVIGTDLARQRLARARCALYTQWSLRGLPETVVDRYFTRRRKGYELAPAIRSAVTFHYLNLIADGYPSTRSGIWEMDLVLCRNVLMYLDSDALPVVAGRLYAALAPGGWLFLAPSDPLLSAFAPFETVMTDRGMAYRRPVATRRPSPPPAIAKPPDAQDAAAAPVSPPRTATRAPAPTGVPPVTAHQPFLVDRDAGSFGPERRGRSGAGETESSAAGHVRQLADAGRLEEAGRACAAALEEQGGSAELLYLHSVLLEQAGHHAQAVTAARRALYIQEDLAVAHIALGNATARLEDRNGARRAFRGAVRLLTRVPPDNPVPASGGEAASRLLELARLRLRLLGEDPA